MRRVSIDTNLLLLLLVGSTAKKYISEHKRLSNYSIDDFETLVDIIGGFSEIVVVAHTLAETSNLIRYIAGPAKARIIEKMRQFVILTSELAIASASAASRHEFITLGLTDCVLLELAAARVNPPTLLTHDLDLAIAAEMQGLPVINFEHFREIR